MTQQNLNRGDIIIISFDLQAGSEIKKRRPAIVLSPQLYNSKSNLILCCPISSTIKRGPWEVLLPEKFKITGAILANQVNSLDQFVRNAKKVIEAPFDIVQEVVAKVNCLLN